MVKNVVESGPDSAGFHMTKFSNIFGKFITEIKY